MTDNYRFSKCINIEKLERESRWLVFMGFLFALTFHGGLLIFTHRETPYLLKQERPQKVVVADIIVHKSDNNSNTSEIGTQSQASKQEQESLPKQAQTNTNPTMSKQLFDAVLPRHLDDINIAGIDSLFLDKMNKETVMAFRIPELNEIIPQDTTLNRNNPREISRKSSLEDEGLSLKEIDRQNIYKGYVIQDYSDKKKVKGFLYIPRMVKDIQAGYNLDAAFVGLAEAVNHLSGIALKVVPPVSLEDSVLFNYPVLYFASLAEKPFELNPEQVQRFGEYLRNGGFAILDNGTPWYDYTPVEATFINLLHNALGKDMVIEPIPADHPIYHCFFDINGLPPEGAENWGVDPLKKRNPNANYFSKINPDPWSDTLHDKSIGLLQKRMSETPSSLWGIWLGERLTAVYCDKGYGYFWRDGIYANQHRNNRPAIELGVNFVVFALIQRGGIAEKNVDYNTK